MHLVEVDPGTYKKIDKSKKSIFWFHETQVKDIRVDIGPNFALIDILKSPKYGPDPFRSVGSRLRKPTFWPQNLGKFAKITFFSPSHGGFVDFPEKIFSILTRNATITTI